MWFDIFCISPILLIFSTFSCSCGPSICFLLKNAYPYLLLISNQIYKSAINFMSSLYILHTNPLSDLWIANIFSHLVGCLFILLITYFAVQKLFSLTYMLYPTWLFCFWCQIQKVIGKTDVQKIINYVLFKGVLRSLSLCSSL